MSVYPIQIITDYRAGKISRQQFCHEWAKLQGFDDTVKGYGNKHGTFITYHEIKAEIRNGQKKKKNNTAKSIREMKNKIDIYAQGEKKKKKKTFPKM